MAVARICTTWQTPRIVFRVARHGTFSMGGRRVSVVPYAGTRQRRRGRSRSIASASECESRTDQLSCTCGAATCGRTGAISECRGGTPCKRVYWPAYIVVKALLGAMSPLVANERRFDWICAACPRLHSSVHKSTLTVSRHRAGRLPVHPCDSGRISNGRSPKGGNAIEYRPMLPTMSRRELLAGACALPLFGQSSGGRADRAHRRTAHARLRTRDRIRTLRPRRRSGNSARRLCGRPKLRLGHRSGAGPKRTTETKRRRLPADLHLRTQAGRYRFSLERHADGHSRRNIEVHLRWQSALGVPAEPHRLLCPPSHARMRGPALHNRENHR